jgi:hypothetical protein
MSGYYLPGSDETVWCDTERQPMDGIAAYYERKRLELEAAQRRLEQAIVAGADEREIWRLTQARDDAGDVGD